MSGVTPDQRPTREGESATERVRAICMDLPLVVERLSHGEASWFINDKKNFVAMSDHHHDDRVSVTFAAGAGVQESLIEEDAERYFRPPYVGGTRLGRRLPGRPRRVERAAVGHDQRPDRRRVAPRRAAQGARICSILSRKRASCVGSGRACASLRARSAARRRCRARRASRDWSRGR